jgi:hypothetical protein
VIAGKKQCGDEKKPRNEKYATDDGDIPATTKSYEDNRKSECESDEASRDQAHRAEKFAAEESCSGCAVNLPTGKKVATSDANASSS